jgi:hypothetical protein
MRIKQKYPEDGDLEEDEENEAKKMLEIAIFYEHKKKATMK